ncbi:MAG: hypothetical protein ABI867_09630 [Kofleriaceae bacterium]
MQNDLAMNKLVMGIVIGVLGVGCGKDDKTDKSGNSGKEVGPEICGLVAAKIKVCAEPFWAVMDKEPDGGLGRSTYEGKEEKMCRDQFQIRQAQGNLFHSCIKTEECKAWAECAVPAFWKARK